MAHASAMVSSSAPSVYSVQALVLLAEVGCWGGYLDFFFSFSLCVFFRSDLSSRCADLGTSSGHGLPQRREGEGCSSYFPHHVLCFPLPKEPQVNVSSHAPPSPQELRIGFCDWPPVSLCPPVPTTCPALRRVPSCWAALVGMPTPRGPGRKRSLSSLWTPSSSAWTPPVLQSLYICWIQSN